MTWAIRSAPPTRASIWPGTERCCWSSLSRSRPGQQPRQQPHGHAALHRVDVICTPNSLSQEVGLGLGAQAGEARLRAVFEEAGFRSFRRAAETPLNLILEARPSCKRPDRCGALPEIGLLRCRQQPFVLEDEPLGPRSARWPRPVSCPAGIYQTCESKGDRSAPSVLVPTRRGPGRAR